MQHGFALSRLASLAVSLGVAAAALAGPSAVGVGVVQAAPANVFEVSATIAAECVVGNTTAMAFGTLPMLSALTGGLSTFDKTATATFDATCTNGTANPTLKFTSTNGGDGVFQLMGPDSVKMAYTLWEGNATTVQISHDQDAAFTGFEADGTVKSLTVTGKIAPEQKNGKPVGSYQDTVLITVGFTPSS